MKKLLIGITLLASMNSFAIEAFKGVDQNGKDCSLNTFVDQNNKALVFITVDEEKYLGERSFELVVNQNGITSSSFTQTIGSFDNTIPNVTEVKYLDEVSVVMESGKPVSYTIVTNGIGKMRSYYVQKRGGFGDLMDSIVFDVQVALQVPLKTKLSESRIECRL